MKQSCYYKGKRTALCRVGTKYQHMELDAYVVKDDYLDGDVYEDCYLVIKNKVTHSYTILSIDDIVDGEVAFGYVQRIPMALTELLVKENKNETI